MNSPSEFNLSLVRFLTLDVTHRCCNCLTESVSESEFYELDLNVQGNGTLSACLAEFLHEEKLEGGAECYSCAVCHSKQEALRFIQLKSLPPILNLQLLRFVYDR